MLVRLAVLKQPCRAIGIFVVLDLTIASPAAFMQALLSTWKIIPNICGSIGHLCLWVYIARGPCSLGKSPQKGHGPPLQLQTPGVQPDGPPLASGGLHPNPSTEEERQMKMLPCSVNSCLKTHHSRLMPRDSPITRDLCLETHASRLVPRDSLPIPLCCKDQLGIILDHIVSFILQLSFTS